MQTTQEKINQAQALFQRLKQIEGAREGLWWKEAECLYQLKETRLYKFVWGGDIYENVRTSWRWFVKEIGHIIFTADYKTSVYKKWVIELGYKPEYLAGVHTRKLQLAIPYAKDRITADKIISEAKEVPFHEFNE